MSGLDRSIDRSLLRERTVRRKKGRIKKKKKTPHLGLPAVRRGREASRGRGRGRSQGIAAGDACPPPLHDLPDELKGMLLTLLLSRSRGLLFLRLLLLLRGLKRGCRSGVSGRCLASCRRRHRRRRLPFALFLSSSCSLSVIYLLRQRSRRRELPCLEVGLGFEFVLERKRERRNEERCWKKNEIQWPTSIAPRRFPSRYFASTVGNQPGGSGASPRPGPRAARRGWPRTW